MRTTQRETNRRTRSASLFVFAGLTVTPISGHTAEVTEFLKGGQLGATVHYEGSQLTGGLEESDIRFSERVESRHDLTLSSEYAPGEGFVVRVAAELTPHWRMGFPGAPDMIFDPTTGGGTYLVGSPPATEATHYASGLKGLWLGASFQPPSNAPIDREQPTQWRLNVAGRAPSPSSNVWSEVDGKRGASMGTTAVHLSAAISSRRGVSDPYLLLAYDRELAGEFLLDNPSRDGDTIEATLQPPSTLTATTGLEWVLHEAPTTEARTALDLRVVTGYRSWGDMASGTYLPSVLPSSYAVPATLEETVFGRAGLGLCIRTAGGVRVVSRMHAEWSPPHRVEHLYNVRTTADTYRLLWSLKVSHAFPVRSTD